HGHVLGHRSTTIREDTLIARSVRPHPSPIPTVVECRKERLHAFPAGLPTSIPAASVVLIPAGTVAPRRVQPVTLHHPDILRGTPDPDVRCAIVVSRCKGRPVIPEIVIVDEGRDSLARVVVGGEEVHR